MLWGQFALFSLGDVQIQAAVVFGLGQDGAGEAYLYPDSEAFCPFGEGGAAGDGDVGGFAGGKGGEEGFCVEVLAVVAGVGQADGGGGQGGVAVVFHMEGRAASEPVFGGDLRRWIGSLVHGFSVPEQRGSESAHRDGRCG